MANLTEIPKIYRELYRERTAITSVGDGAIAHGNKCAVGMMNLLLFPKHLGPVGTKEATCC